MVCVCATAGRCFERRGSRVGVVEGGALTRTTTTNPCERRCLDMLRDLRDSAKRESGSCEKQPSRKFQTRVAGRRGSCTVNINRESCGGRARVTLKTADTRCAAVRPAPFGAARRTPVRSCCCCSSAARAPSDVRGGSSNQRSCSCAGAAFRGGAGAGAGWVHRSASDPCR